MSNRNPRLPKIGRLLLCSLVTLSSAACTYTDGVDVIRVNGALVGPDGSPLKEQPVAAGFEPVPVKCGSPPRSQVTTNDDGRFSISVVRRWGGARLFNLIPLGCSGSLETSHGYKRVYVATPDATGRWHNINVSLGAENQVENGAIWLIDVGSLKPTSSTGQ